MIKIKKFFTLFLSLSMLLSVMITTAMAVEPTYTVSKQYRESKYYENLKKIPLSGDMAADVIAIALSQLGYHEGNGNADLGGLNEKGTKDFVEYNVLYGKLDNNQGNGLSYGYYWCASFVNWCLRQAGVSDSASAAAEVSCRRWLAKCREAGIYSDKAGYIPKSADLIFFKDADSEVTSTHMGIVLYSDGDRVYTVEGNTSAGGFSSDGNYVAVKSYKLMSNYIVGYATPEYERNIGAGEVDYSSNAMSTGLYISECEIECFPTSDMDGDGSAFGAYEVFSVREIFNGKFHLTCEIDGEETDCWADIRGKARQLTAEGEALTVSFVDDDEKDVLPKQYRSAETPIYIPDDILESEEAGFLGWARTEDQQEILILPGETVDAVSEHVVFHAVWDHTQYRVIFKNADGVVISEIIGYYGDSFEIPTVENIPDGFEFDCWDDENISTVITGNAAYTAIYKELPNDETSSENENSIRQDLIAGCRSGIGSQAVIASVLVALIKCFKKKRS